MSHFFKAKEREAAETEAISPNLSDEEPEKVVSKSREIKLRNQFPNVVAKIQESWANFNNPNDLDNFLKADILTTL